MISDFFINTVKVISRQEEDAYEDGISKKKYKECCKEIKCRVSSLNYKDLQLLQWIDDVQIRVQKLYTWPEVMIKATDFVEYNGEKYEVINQYFPQDKEKTHHHKYFIKLVK